jgi:hypothetical protein
MLSFDVADMLCAVSRGRAPDVWMLQPLFFDVADAESRCYRHVLLGVANIIFKCCRCCVSMSQTCGVGCCVEEKREESS